MADRDREQQRPNIPDTGRPEHPEHPEHPDHPEPPRRPDHPDAPPDVRPGRKYARG
jgi:hypothetical protein